MSCFTTPLLRLLGLALVALVAGSPAPAQAQWQRCASQDEVCRFRGEALVRYGSEGRYEYRVARNRILCDVRDFGNDPARGVRKQCAYNYDLDARDPGNSRGWTHCARESEYCRVPGSARVRYGVGGRYVYRDVSGGVQCSYRVFGDPAQGEHKTCQYQGGGREPDNGGGGRGWEYCGSEGGYCTFRGPAEVRYGVNGRFVVRRAVDGMPCSLRAFGEDPARGEQKQCFVRSERR